MCVDVSAGLRLGLYNPTKSLISSLQQHSKASSSSSSSSSNSSSVQLPPVQGSSTMGGSSSSSSSSSNPAGVSVKVLAGIASGAVAAALLSPTELVKVRQWCCKAVKKILLAILLLALDG